MRIERMAFRPATTTVDEVLSATKNLKPDSPALEAWHASFTMNHAARIALDLELVRKYASTQDSILEVGSIPLFLTASLIRSGYQIVGCDIAPERYGTAIKQYGIDVRKCDIEKENLPFPENSFDIVVFNELFEHLRINPIYTMSEVLKVLKPNGRLILTTPNLRSLAGLRNFLLHNRAYSCTGNIYDEYEKLTKIGHMGHVREYTTTEVCDFLSRVGFQPEKIFFRGDLGNRIEKLLVRAFQKLRPFATYIATKPIS